MRTLLVIGGEGNMTGMMADRISDDMAGLLTGLKDTRQYRQIVLMPSSRFLQPPEDPLSLLPLADFDAHLIEEARKNPGALRTKILRVSTKQALRQFYETLLSFLNGRQVVLICTPGNELAESLLPFFSSVDTLEHRVECDKLPLLSGIKDWTVCFTRIPTPLTPEALLPSEVLKLNFPWDIQVAARDVLQTLRHLLENPAPVSYPAEDALLYPRAMLAEGKRGGFLLAIPRPSNMKNFSITLQTGKGLKKESPVTENPGKKAVKIERDWMTRDEVAEVIRKSKDSVDNYCREGKLESYKAGREVRISRESVQKYLENR
jgi:excisionase family DNA binding protein